MSSIEDFIRPYPLAGQRDTLPSDIPVPPTPTPIQSQTPAPSLDAAVAAADPNVRRLDSLFVGEVINSTAAFEF